MRQLGGIRSGRGNDVPVLDDLAVLDPEEVVEHGEGPGLGRSQEVLLAAPALAAGIATLDDLRAHSWICHDQIAERVTLHGPRRKRVTIAMRAQVRVNDSTTQRSLLLAGVGVGMQPLLLVGEALRNGDLVQVLPRYRISPVEIFILLPTRKHIPLRTRLLIQGLQERIRSLTPRSAK